MIIIPDKLRRPAEVERDELKKQLAEARAEIEILKNQLEDESMRADGMTTAHAEAGADSYRMRELIEQMREALSRLPAKRLSRLQNQGCIRSGRKGRVMSSKRRIRRKSCDGKRQHDTQAAAIGHKMHLITYGTTNTGELWVYRCEFCNKWHVGHPPAELVAKQRFYSENK